ncbi:hypothetical protein [Flavobacterium columnare]|uniref:Uncharacterized protein n=1 Tax=Flavobacterium columnare TaxID=996 RepID=A0AAI8GA17_9FLAO|nr:hypothetical protein [Flavobacterium columnare]AMO19051.1 hypothetical protein UN65_00600 [Flavobacterium columnare]AMO19053.1 hypothetical protein UN65_00610 [Flavobacterium columnare]AUX16976.1 hypothetical protein AQ623_00630 [Flavobacterium columnare]AUX16978.1 hypothetical protein AQ623_00640 [Flavobacterium columnare]QOG55984.1 hypothetical protein HUE29_00605 [Flavobacterium columnare]
MSFTEFTNLAMPYINFIIGSLIGLVIFFKNSEITALKTNVSTLESIIKHYDVDQFKKNVDLKIENLTLEHKKEIENVFKRSEESVKDKILELSMPWLVKYNELLDYEFHYLIKLSDEDLDKVLNLLPHNRQFIETQLKDIKSGKLKPLN